MRSDFSLNTSLNVASILLCEVRLNKDRGRERERKRGNSSSRTTGT